MGTDDLFKKRKAGNTEKLKRKKKSREPYDKLLIVTEGKKTEPNYLNVLRDYLKLSQANIHIDPNSDSTPTSVVRYAKKMIDSQPINDPYNHVFCVMDKDQHTDFNQALDQIREFNNRNGNKSPKLYPIVSTPCFEYWLLLHHTYITRSFYTGGNSPCDNVVTELKKYITNYRKNDKNCMLQLVENNLEQAIVNAENARKAAAVSYADSNASQTLMGALVYYLKNLKGNSLAACNFLEELIM